MKIRRAKPDDLPQMVTMGERFLNNEDYKGVIAFDAGHVEDLMARLGSSPDSILLVADPGNDAPLVGMIAFVVYPHPISRERVGGEVFWWCEQKGTGLKLLRAAEAWAEEAGATILQMIAPNERVARLYSHLGYARVEETWQRRL